MLQIGKIKITFTIFLPIVQQLRVFNTSNISYHGCAPYISEAISIDNCSAFRKLSGVSFTSYAILQLTTHLLIFYLFRDIDFHNLVVVMRRNYQAANNKVLCYRNLREANFNLNSIYAQEIAEFILHKLEVNAKTRSPVVYVLQLRFN